MKIMGLALNGDFLFYRVIFILADVFRWSRGYPWSAEEQADLLEKFFRLG